MFGNSKRSQSINNLFEINIINNKNICYVILENDIVIILCWEYCKKF